LASSLKAKFLLDENVSINLKKLLESEGYEVETIQELNKSAIKNSELIELTRIKGKILITCDKDFLYMQKTSEIFLIVIDIHPLVDENVLPAFKNFLTQFNTSILDDHFIIIHENNFELKKRIT